VTCARYYAALAWRQLENSVKSVNKNSQWPHQGSIPKHAGIRRVTDAVRAYLISVYGRIETMFSIEWTYIYSPIILRRRQSFAAQDAWSSPL
jgi:hypothetical protein